MKRTTPLLAKTQLKRGGPIKPKKRKPTEYARIWGSRNRVLTIKALACWVCGRGPSENCHLGNEGMGRRSGYQNIVNLCAAHHRTAKDSLHNLGSVEAFDRVHDTDLRARAAFLAEFLHPARLHVEPPRSA